MSRATSASELLARDLKCLQIRHGKLRLVVEHFLEVRHEPLARPPSSGGIRRPSWSFMPPFAISRSVNSTMSALPRFSVGESNGRES